MILSDRDIRRRMQEAGDLRIIAPTEGEDVLRHLGPSSVDLRLGHHFKIYEHGRVPVLDPKTMKEDQALTRLIEVHDGAGFVVQPGEFVLGVTLERVELPADLVARVEGRSSLGRLGIVVHSTAGFVDAGFCGTITLEITNINRMPVALYPGQRVCQLAFHQMTSPADLPYHAKPGQKYQGQSLPQESRVHLDDFFTKE